MSLLHAFFIYYAVTAQCQKLGKQDIACSGSTCSDKQEFEMLTILRGGGDLYVFPKNGILWRPSGKDCVVCLQIPSIVRVCPAIERTCSLLPPADDLPVPGASTSVHSPISGGPHEPDPGCAVDIRSIPLVGRLLLDGLTERTFTSSVHRQKG